MAEPNTVRVLRMNNVRSDGRTNTELVPLVVRHPVTREEIRNDDGTPAVVIDLQPISDEEHEAILKAHTSLQRAEGGGRQLFPVVDGAAVTAAILRRGIVAWRGLVGADDRPLVCTDQTKPLLDDAVRNQVLRKLFGGEVVEITAESFREPA